MFFAEEQRKQQKKKKKKEAAESAEQRFPPLFIQRGRQDGRMPEKEEEKQEIFVGIEEEKRLQVQAMRAIM